MERLFIRWVKFPEDAPIRSFWEKWLEKFPEMRETVDSASELVRISSGWQPRQQLSPEEVNSIWGRIRSSIGQIGQVKEMEPLQSRLQILQIRLLYYKWYVIISVAFVILVLLWLAG